MGCVQSGRGAPAAESDEAEGPSGTADSKRRPRCKQLRIVDSAPAVRSSDSLKIRIIWRRVSIFGNRRDSIRSTKSATSVTALPEPSESDPENSPLKAEPPPHDSCLATNRDGE